jgi:DNA mismatch endonuclease (patch repair protein)
MTPAAEAASGRWKDKPPPDRVWRGRPGLTRAQRTAEQDRAAGGNDRRLVDLGDGRTAQASIELKVLPRTRRIRAYLRWSDKGRSPTKYIGEVNEATRMRNLEAAWRRAHERELLLAPTVSDGSWASSSAVRKVMKANRGRDTRPELALRSAAHRLGLRFRVDFAVIPGLRRRADLVFRRARVAVFSDGCYWHGCSEHYRPATRNGEFWTAKIEANRSRDLDTDTRLHDAGWLVIRIWEHEDPASAAERIAETIHTRLKERTNAEGPREDSGTN